MATELSAVVWDGEVPRYTTAGVPINPEATGSPAAWPVVRVYMDEQGFKRKWTTEDPYDDEGMIHVQIYGISRAQVEAMMNRIEALLAKDTVWPEIELGGDQ